MSRSVYLYFFFFTDTYVKVCVLVQNKVVKTKKTEVHKKTDTPNYNESFTFKLPVTSLDSASLSLTIMQHSSGHKGEWMTGDDSGWQWMTVDDSRLQVAYGAVNKHFFVWAVHKKA